MEKFKKVLTEDFIRSSPIWGSKVKKLLIDKLRSANESAAEGNWGPLVALRNHVALQVQSYRLTSKKQSVPKGDFRLRNLPEAYGRGELYTRPHSNVDENRLVEGLKRSLNFQSVMASTARPDLGIRGGLTFTEMRELDPGLYTGDDFDYLREQEEEQRERYRDRLHAHRVRIDRAKNWTNNKRTERWQRIREDNLYRQDMESRHSRMRRQQQINLAYENMSEKERFIHENAPRFGGKSAAEGVWSKREREIVLKGLPEFFKNSKLSTKTLQRISKAGSALGISRIAKNPFMLGASLGLGALVIAGKAASGFTSGSSAATNIENWKNFTGGVSPSFMKAAALAGYKDISSIASIYTDLTSKYGDAELFLKSIGESTPGLSGIGKIRLAQSLGLDQTSIALAEILAGTFGNISKSREEQARYTFAKIEADIMSSAESKLRDRLTGVFGQSMLGIGVYGTANEYANKHMFDEFKKASDAAESADVFESQSNSNIENVSNKTSSTGFYINNIDVHANDPGQFVSELEGIAKSHGINKNDVLDNADSRMVA